MLNAAIIGISGYGRVHLRMLEYQASKNRARLVAVVSVNPKEDAEVLTDLKRGGCCVYSDYRELLHEWRGRLDLCMIPTPIHLHEEMTIAALRSGANVLVEKPLSSTVESCRRIQREAQVAGKFVAVGFQKLYSPSNVRIKQLLLDGYLGRLVRMRGVALWPRGINYYQRNGWAGKERVNGRLVLDSPLSNACAHFLHLMLYWASPDRNGVATLTKSIVAETYRANRIESFDTVSLSGATEGLGNLHFYASHASKEKVEPIIRVEGELGSLEWKRGEGTCIERRGDDPIRIPATNEEVEVRSMIDLIVHRIETGTGDICGIEQALPHVEIVEHLYRSFETRSIDSSFIETELSSGDERLFVSGLTNATLEAFEKCIHYSATGQKWTKRKTSPADAVASES